MGFGIKMACDFLSGFNFYIFSELAKRQLCDCLDFWPIKRDIN